MAKNQHLAKVQGQATMLHPDSPPHLRNAVVAGDVRETLKLLPDAAVHLTFTSPPYYNARDYSQFTSYGDYLDFLDEVFIHVYRITKPGRFLVVNTSPVLTPRDNRNKASQRHPIPYDLHPRLQMAGWEFIDDIHWVKPAGSVKNRNGNFFQHRKPLTYKPNSVTEQLMVYRKNTGQLIDWNLAQYPDDIKNASAVGDPYEQTNIWHLPTASHAVHPAVFPAALAGRVIGYYSFIRDLVFDPFAGVGTVGQAARVAGRYYLLCEQHPDYLQSLVDVLAALPPLFTYPLPKHRRTHTKGLEPTDFYDTSTQLTQYTQTALRDIHASAPTASCEHTD